MDPGGQPNGVGMGAGQERQGLYLSLMGTVLFLRGPVEQPPAVTEPESGLCAVPVFFTEEAALQFWQQLSPENPGQILSSSFQGLARAALRAGAVVVEPAGASLVLDRAELSHLANGEIPWQFARWLREPARLGRSGAEVLAQLRPSHVYVLTGKDSSGQPRLYLLEKSEDGTPAVACFSSPESLAQFAQVRRLFERHQAYGAALIQGEQCIRAAGGLGAYILVDPESPWESLIEPTLP